MNILLIGCGKMGQAMLNGWLASGISASSVKVVDPIAQISEVECFASIGELDQSFAPDYVIIAVKPQIVEDIIDDIKKFSDASFVSIMAGKKISYLQNKLGDAKIIRAMPNLPATIGKGITALVGSGNISSEKEQIGKLFNSIGSYIWLDNEAEMDAVTALSGSGPAYIFLFLKSMIDAGVELGLDEEKAKALAFKTFEGSVQLATDSKESLEQLISNVCSKGGTTEAAINSLKDNGLPEIVEKAVIAANNRSKELSE